MEVIHRIVFRIEPHLQDFIDHHKLTSDDDTIVFLISESDPRWPEVTSKIKEYNLFHLIYPKFSLQELK